ncbi:MAG: hypothetical protein J6P95_04530 [Paludibacteraceae bacterium]|nr:hypothetical protein [Paludibacteraceae bacterium]
MNWLKENKSFLVVSAIFLIVKFFLLNTYFFWDSLVIISRPATYLYDNGLFSLPFPVEFGVAPNFPQFYTALMWKIFGRTLLVSHLCYLPFVFFLLFQTYILCKRFVGREFLFLAFLFVVSDATFLTQTLGLYADLFLMTFAVWSINNILRSRRLLLTVSLFLLSTVGERGMLVAVALTLLFLVVEYRNGLTFWSSLRNTILIFSPTLLCLVSFVVYQKITTGYLLLDNSDNSDWGEHWRLVDFQYFVKNILVLGFRFVEYGRIFLWIAFIYLFIKFKKNAVEPFLLIAYSIVLGFLLLATLPWYNPFGMRYFLLLYLLFSINLARSITLVSSQKKAKALLLILTIVLSSCHFFIYPEKLAQSWDSSLAHTPYFELRKKTIFFIEENNIPFSEVGVSFPLTEKCSLTDLSNENQQFDTYNFERNKWIIYTNIGNVDSPSIDSIRQQILVQRFEKNGVFFEIYKIK